MSKTNALGFAHCSKLIAHCCLPLALFVFRVDADHAHHTFAVNDLALVANLLYGRPNFHNSKIPLCSPVTSVVSRCGEQTICSDTQFFRDSGRRAKALPLPCRPAGCG